MIKKEYVYFSVIVMLMAFMDGFNFYFPHNEGWFSLTYGEGSNNWDAWHCLKRLLLGVIALYMIKDVKNVRNVAKDIVVFVLIAYGLQLLIYDVLIKL